MLLQPDTCHVARDSVLCVTLCLQRRLVERGHFVVRAHVRRGAVFVSEQQSNVRFHRVLVQDAVLPSPPVASCTRHHIQAAVQVLLLLLLLLLLLTHRILTRFDVFRDVPQRLGSGVGGAEAVKIHP